MGFWNTFSKKREGEIESNFSCEITFSYPIDEDELGDKLEEFKLDSESENNNNNNNVNVFGEKSVRDINLLFLTMSQLIPQKNSLVF